MAWGTTAAEAAEQQEANEGQTWIRYFKDPETRIRIAPYEAVRDDGVTVYGTDAWPTTREHFKNGVGSFPCGKDNGIQDCPGCADPDSRVRERSRKYFFPALDDQGVARIFKMGPRSAQAVPEPGRPHLGGGADRAGLHHHQDRAPARRPTTTRRPGSSTRSTSASWSSPTSSRRCTGRLGQRRDRLQRWRAPTRAPTPTERLPADLPQDGPRRQRGRIARPPRRRRRPRATGASRRRPRRRPHGSGQGRAAQGRGRDRSPRTPRRPRTSPTSQGAGVPTRTTRRIESADTALIKQWLDAQRRRVPRRGPRGPASSPSRRSSQSPSDRPWT